MLSLKVGHIIFDEVKSSLSTIYERDVAWHLLPSLKEAPPSAETALYSQSKGEWKGKGKGKGKRDKWDKGKITKDPKQFDKQYICFNCPKTDHKTKDCPQPLTIEARQKQAAWWEERKKQSKGKREVPPGRRPEKDASCLAIEISPLYFSDLHSPTSPLSSALAVRGRSHLRLNENYNRLESKFVSCQSPTINLFFGSSNNDDTHQVSPKSLLSLKTTEPEALSLSYHPITRDLSTGLFRAGLDAVFSDSWSEIDPTIPSQCTAVEGSEVYELGGQCSLVSWRYIARA